jgi:hypothetical protein
LGALGALVGGLIGNRKREQQFSSVRMNELVASLVPGTSTLVAVVEREHVADLEKGLESFEAEIFTADVSADLAEKPDSQPHAADTDWIEKLD